MTRVHFTNRQVHNVVTALKSRWQRHAGSLSSAIGSRLMMIPTPPFGGQPWWFEHHGVRRSYGLSVSQMSKGAAPRQRRHPLPTPIRGPRSTRDRANFR